MSNCPSDVLLYSAVLFCVKQLIQLEIKFYAVLDITNKAFLLSFQPSKTNFQLFVGDSDRPSVILPILYKNRSFIIQMTGWLQVFFLDKQICVYIPKKSHRTSSQSRWGSKDLYFKSSLCDSIDCSLILTLSFTIQMLSQLIKNIYLFIKGCIYCGKLKSNPLGTIHHDYQFRKKELKHLSHISHFYC